MLRFPNLFIVGAPKSGTTSLYEYLKGHPQVFMAAIKEPNYFAADLDRDVSGTSLHFERDEADYLALFDAAGDAPVVGEGSTRYLYSREAPRLIHVASPEARIVAMVRNPIDMAASLHAHKLAAGTEDVVDFAAAIAAEPERRAGRSIPAHSNPLLATYTDRARVGEQVVRWLDEFGRDRVHVIVFEDMRDEPAAQFRRLLDFLAIDADWRPASFDARNPAHAARSGLVRRLTLSRPAQWLAWKALPAVLGGVRARRLVGAFSHSRLRRRPAHRTAVPDELRRRLEAEFKPDVQLLGSLIERDLVERWFGQSAGALHRAQEPSGS